MEATLTNFQGLWTVLDAYLPNGQFAYTGTIDISCSGPLHRLVWNISAGSYVGIGLAHEDRLFVSCGETFADLGFAILLQQTDGSYLVNWCESESIEKAQIDKGSAAGPGSGSGEGLWQIQLDHPLYGGTERWELRLGKNRDVYEFDAERTDGVRRRGLGLSFNRGIALGWYSDFKQLAFMDYRMTAPNTVSAVWGLGGFNTLGTETLCRES